MKKEETKKNPTGIVVNTAEPKIKGQRRVGYIDPDDPNLRDRFAKARAKLGIRCKDPGNISFIMPHNDHDTFFACEGNEYGIKYGHRVSFQWRWDKKRLPQAYDVHIERDEDERPLLVEPVQRKPEESVERQVERIQEENRLILDQDDAAAINAALGAYAAEQPAEDDFEDGPEYLDGEDTEDEIDQDEVDFEAYYEN